MRQQLDENISAEWEESSLRQEAGTIWGVGAHLQAAFQRQISLVTCMLLVTTVMITLISMEVLFGAGMLVGALLAPICSCIVRRPPPCTHEEPFSPLASSHMNAVLKGDLHAST